MGAGVTASVGFTGTITEAQYATLNKPHAHDFCEGVAPTAGTGVREVDVAAGTVWALGGYHTISASTVTLPENTSGQPRVDTVVLSIDYSSDDAALGYVQGTPAASPVPPDLTRTAGATWQVPICDVTVANGAGVLASSAVKDSRPGPWIDLEHNGWLLNNWIPYSTGTPTNPGGPHERPGIKMASDGTVRMRGLVRKNSGTLSAPEVLFYLPYRFQPRRELIFAAANNNATWGDLTGEIRVRHSRGDSAIFDLAVFLYRWPDRDVSKWRWVELNHVWDVSDNGRI